MSATDDALGAVQAELSAAMVPWPDDYVEELSPQAALFVLRQMGMASMRIVTGAAISLGEDGEEPGGAVAEVMNGVAAAIAGSTHALVVLGVLPREAEEALESGGV